MDDDARQGSAVVRLVTPPVTYPIELLASAQTLATEATKYPPTDERQIPPPMQRALARGAIFTAFNFVESSFIGLVQNCIVTERMAATVVQDIEAKLAKGRASISQIIKTWPAMLGKTLNYSDHRFRGFSPLRRLRNNLTHPKLRPLTAGEMTEDQLLKAANAGNAAWAVGHARLVGQFLYDGFGREVPYELSTLVTSGLRLAPKPKW